VQLKSFFSITRFMTGFQFILSDAFDDLDTWSFHFPMLSILITDFFVVIDLVADVEKAIGAEVLELVVLLPVVFNQPLGLVVGVGVVQVEDVGFNVGWNHSDRVNVDDVEAWRLALVSGDGAGDEVEQDRLVLNNIPDNLELLGMNM